MKPKTTIVLGVLLLACVVLALFSGDLFTSSKKPDDDAQAKEEKLFDPAPGKAVRLTLEGKTGSFVFRKEGDEWRILQPIRAKADKWDVDSIADAVKDLKGYVAEGVGNETTGLDKPLWTVTVVDEKDKTFRVLVGRPRPMKDNETYVRLGGSKQVHVAKVDLAYKLNKTLSEFRSDSVLDLKTDKIARVRITGRESFELVKKGDAWGIVQPISASADADKVKDLLDDVARVTASEFVDDEPEDLAPYGLDTPSLLAEIEMQPEKPATSQATTQETQPAPPKAGRKYGLAIGKRVRDKLYAKLTHEKPVFKVNESLLKDLQPKLVDLRVKKVLSLTRGDVAGVELVLPSGKATLSKQDAQWRMTAPLKGAADEDAVEKLLGDAADLKAADFKDGVEDLGLYGLDKPAGKITFRLAGKDETTTLLIGRKTLSGEMTFVKSAAGQAVAVVPTGDVKGLLAEPPTYWSRGILKLPDDAEVTHLQLRRTDETFTLARDPNDDWQLSTPLAAPGDKDHVEKVVDHLEDLRADKIVYLGPTIPDMYARAKDIMQVLVTAETPAPVPETQPASRPATQATTQATRPAATQPAATKPAATQPAATKPAATRPAPKPSIEKHQITVAKVGLHSYAWLAGTKVLAVGEFAPSLYDDLAAELRSRRIWTLDPDKIRGIRLTAEADSLELRKDGEDWTYTADRYVKIDAEKVGDYLKDIKELEAERFATHAPPPDPAKYALDKPWLTLEVTDEKGAASSLSLSHTGVSKTEDRYGQASAVPGVFVVSASDIEKLSKKLKDFKK